MENKNAAAATLQKKKTTINKAKVKKTIKNTLCRPDPVFWPVIGGEQAKELEAALASHKVELSVFHKSHWKILKCIPKNQRPKQPKIIKVDGLIFGITQSSEAIHDNQCSAVILESTVNPWTIVQPLIEACISNKVNIVCLNGLRKMALAYFGIPTSCLAIKTGFLQDISSKIEDLSKLHKVPNSLIEKETNVMQLTIESTEKLEFDNNTEKETSSAPTSFTYLYRTSKNTRVFNPSVEEPKAKKAFIGQNYIEFSNIPEQKPSDNKPYKSMILKRITNNQNRTKTK